MFPPVFSIELFIFVFGSSNKTKARNFGVSDGNTPIKDVITFFRIASFLSFFFEVPVFPPTEIPSTEAYFPVPSYTIL